MTDTWEAQSIPPYKTDDDLFVAIITADAGKRLVAQCTSLEVAEFIVALNESHKRLLEAIVRPAINAIAEDGVSPKTRGVRHG